MVSDWLEDGQQIPHAVTIWRRYGAVICGTVSSHGTYGVEMKPFTIPSIVYWNQ